MEDKTKKITRRKFFGKICGSTALAACAGFTGWFFHNKRLVPKDEQVKEVKNFSVEGTNEEMVVARGTDGAKLVAAALKQIGGISRFVNSNDKVLIKPNCAFDRPPHLGATTSPEVLGEIVRQCVSTGAEVFVTDNPINNAEGCFIKSGLRKAVETAGGEIILPKPYMFSRTRIGKLAIPDWEVLYNPLSKATKIIGVPTVKTHNLCHASLSMKNWYGLLGGPRNRLHQDIHNVIADLGLFIKPTLIVLDGTRLLVKNGPTGGSMADVKSGNVVAVGTDQVAIDAFGATLLDIKPENIDYLLKAEKIGIGNIDFKKLKVFKEIEV